MHDSANEASTQPTEQGIVPSTVDFPVIGIGASAGGLSALLRFFENMPGDNGMAFVVILHLSPKHQSSADHVLQRVTRMPVTQVTKPVPIERNHVYVIAPNQQLSMVDGFLSVKELQRPRGAHVAIDIFFRTLAEVHRERAVAIVLSGSGSDGAVGLTRVKEQGGVTLAQSPPDAEHDGMPQAAIRTGIVDFVLPVVEMPQKLIELWNNARTRALTRLAPPSVILDRESNIVHMSDDATRFMRMVGGEPSRNVLALVRPELRLELRSALYQAQQSGSKVECNHISLDGDGEPRVIGMKVIPYQDEDSASDLMLVLFQEVPREHMAAQVVTVRSDDVVLTQLETELQRKKEQLQETIEHSEISTEELRASNEELQAINEELRSATEELETSGTQGLEVLEEHDIDLLISDISMPEMDGCEFLQAARRMPRYRKLPAIAISGLGRQKDIARARESGFAAHLGKPMSMDRLTAIVSEVLEQNWTAS